MKNKEELEQKLIDWFADDEIVNFQLIEGKIGLVIAYQTLAKNILEFLKL